MADDGAPSAAPWGLLELLARANELNSKRRFEPAVAKLQEAIALARETTPPLSLLRVFALLQHAENAAALQLQLLHSNTGGDRTTYDAEEALCAVAYASLQEALPILFARAEANTLLPGRVPADEEQSFLRLLILAADKGTGDDNSAAAVAARMANLRDSRGGQYLGYRVFVQAALCSLLPLCPELLNNPFPPLRTDDDIALQEISMMTDCIMQAVRWLGACTDAAIDGGPPEDDTTTGVKWRIGGRYGIVIGAKLCSMVSDFLERTEEDVQMRVLPDRSFRHALDKVWHSPQLAKRRHLWAETGHLTAQSAEVSFQRADADVARLGLATCSNAGCAAVESCPKAFKRCSRCHSVVYCSRDCQLAAWPSHKRDCKRMAAEREANANAAA